MRRTVGGGPYRGTFTAAVFSTWYFTAMGIFSCVILNEEIHVNNLQKIKKIELVSSNECMPIIMITHYNAMQTTMSP